MDLRPFLAGLIFFSTLTACWASQVDDLKKERSSVEKALAEAIASQNEVSGGLLKSVISTRVEILRLNAALIQHRIHSLESGAKIVATAEGSVPDPQRALELGKEIAKLADQIAADERKHAQYSGGLIRAMGETGTAVTRISKEMLHIEYLKAKYGVRWLAPIKPDSSPTGREAGFTPKVAAWQQEAKEGLQSRPEGILSFTLTRKRYRPSDYQRGIHQDSMMFDAEWDTSKLPKPARAVKGVMIFADLFGESQFMIKTTIDKPMTPNKKFVQTDIGFDFNNFKSDHQWVRATDISNMTFKFELAEVIYSDGTREKP